MVVMIREHLERAELWGYCGDDQSYAKSRLMI